MNKANYTGRPQRNFPLSTEGLDFIQQQILMASEYAKSAGGNYILSGCQTNGGNVSQGALIIDGEILPFTGGSLQTKVRIVQTADNITAGSETYDAAYIRRRVEFGSNIGNVDTFLWADFKQFPTAKFLLENSATKTELQELRDLIMPKGAIIMWSGSVENLPTGFALCNGLTVSGVATPDLRGRFVIGFDAGKPNTPANANDLTENYGKVGNTGGRAGVMLATAEMPAHNHAVTDPGHIHDLNLGIRGNENGSNQYTIASGRTGRQSLLAKTGIGIGNSGGNQTHENRPPYYVLAYIIKVV